MFEADSSDIETSCRFWRPSTKAEHCFPERQLHTNLDSSVAKEISFWLCFLYPTEMLESQPVTFNSDIIHPPKKERDTEMLRGFKDFTYSGSLIGP